MISNNFLNRCTVYSLLVILSLVQLSCKKYLDVKPIKSRVIPETLSDLRALLDNHSIICEQSPGMLDVVADDYYLTTASWNGLTGARIEERTNYIWNSDAEHKNSWNLTYQGPIYVSNVVLDQLPEIDIKGQLNLFNEIKGSALFYRAFAFYQIAQLYCKPYSNTSSSDPGIVLRLKSAIGNTSVRSTVEETYNQIIQDFEEAAQLLPESTDFPTRPNKAAVFGALARTYLSMRDYVNAGRYADSCLRRSNSLMDFNLMGPPFTRFNEESIYYSRPPALTILTTSRAKIDSSLYKLYQSDDLRKSRFFKANTGANAGTYSFQGSYGGIRVNDAFDGITTGEMYLIRAECFGKQNNKDSAIFYLNSLMIKRWSNNGTWVPFDATDAADAVNKIRTERRKELVFRSLRWSDLRRYNLEGANIELKRVINGTDYVLPANGPKWVLLIPFDVIKLSGIQQNPR